MLSYRYCFAGAFAPVVYAAKVHTRRAMVLLCLVFVANATFDKIASTYFIVVYEDFGKGKQCALQSKEGICRHLSPRFKGAATVAKKKIVVRRACNYMQCIAQRVAVRVIILRVPKSTLPERSVLTSKKTARQRCRLGVELFANKPHPLNSNTKCNVFFSVAFRSQLSLSVRSWHRIKTPRKQ